MNNFLRSHGSGLRPRHGSGTSRVWLCSLGSERAVLATSQNGSGEDRQREFIVEVSSCGCSCHRIA